MKLLLFAVMVTGAEFLFAQTAKVIPFIDKVGGRVDWSQTGIFYDNLKSIFYYNVSIIQPDGSGYQELTKNKPGCPQKNNGQPVVDPSARYMVFQAEKDVNFDSTDVHYGPSLLSHPGAGINCDLWVLDLQTSVFTRLTKLPTKKSLEDTTKFSGVLHPQFSHNGKKLLWGECLDAGSGDGFGFWRLNISDFDTTGGAPQLINTVHYDSGGALGHFTFIETSGFTSNDSSVIYCANAIAGQSVEELDIYIFNFYTQELINLTPDTLEYDEHAHLNSDGSKVLWMSSRDIPNNNMDKPKADYWIMDNDGANKTRLTFFNDSGSIDYQNFARVGRVIASDNTWSPFGGDTALCYLQVYDSLDNYCQQIVFLEISYTAVEVIPAVKRKKSNVFPNPASLMLNVKSPTGNADKIYIYDLAGRNIAEYKFSNQINVSQLSPGIYLLRIADKKGASIDTHKLIVN